MPNTFEPVPESGHERSTAFLEVSDPSGRLESYMEEAQLHRGSLREQDGYIIPFREGGQVRITVQEAGEGQPAGLRFEVDAPTQERRAYVEDDVNEQVGERRLDWQRD